MQTDIVHLLKQLDKLERSLRGKGYDASGSTRSVSGDPFVLDTAPATSARISSTARIGAVGTSVSPREPDWDLFSSARLSIIGEYDGSQGEGSIEFTVGGNPLLPNFTTVDVQVTAPDGSDIGTFSFNRSDPSGTSHDLGNGLSFSLEPSFLSAYPWAGNATRADLSTGGVNIDNPFNGIGSAGPDFDGGASVTAGSFTLNGESIVVLADDSVSDVLARINASAAGVTARFDAPTETIEIVSNTAGSSADIVLADDSSGFLDAVKLTNADLVPGQDGAEDRPIGELASFAGVSSGSIDVNGQSVVIDIATDSLRDVVDRIDAATTDVNATLKQSDGASWLELSGTAPQVELTGGATGLFSALGLGGLTYALGAQQADAQPSSTHMLRRRSYRAADAVEEVQQNFERLFSRNASAQLAPLRESLSTLLLEVTEEYGEGQLERLGLALSSAEEGFLETGRLARRRFTQAIQSESDLLQRLMLSDRMSDGDKGFIEALRTLLKEHLKSMGLSVTGQLIDMRV